MGQTVLAVVARAERPSGWDVCEEQQQQRDRAGKRKLRREKEKKNSNTGVGVTPLKGLRKRDSNTWETGFFH